MRYDVRPRWQRWLSPHGHGGLVALSIAWFIVGLVGVIAAELTYGWRSAPIQHAWHVAAWAALASWIIIGPRLHRRRPTA